MIRGIRQIKLTSLLLDKPLSQTELDELENLLHSDAVPDDCMDLAMLDGFLTALTIGPTLVPPSEWLPKVWGEQDEEAIFESFDEAERVIGLLMRFYNEIVRRFMEAPEEFSPLLNECEQDGKPHLSGEEWCLGFSLGVGLRSKDWEPLFEDENHVSLLAPIIWFSSEGTRQEIAAGHDPEAAREMMLGLIGPAVVAIDAFWRPYRKMRPTGLRTESFGIGRKPRVGRNDPCPCGSEKKFKKCCGAAPA